METTPIDGRPLVVTPEVTLTGGYDVEAEARRVPSAWVVKGMFFARVVEALGPGLADVLPQLDKPPPRGRYTAFRDYPQSDYGRLSAAAALTRHPGLPLNEAARRFARDDFEVFGRSTLGKVVLAAVGDARAALLRTPSVYKKLASGDYEFTGRELDAETVRLEIVPAYGHFCYQLGQVEGIVLHFLRTPRVTVTQLPGRKLRLDVTHSGH